MILGRLRSFSAWMLGFFLIVNVYLIPSLEQTPRAADLIGAGLGIWLIWRFITQGMRFEALLALYLFSAIPAIWGLNAYYMEDTSTALFSVRWLLAIPWGYVLFLVSRDPQHRTPLVWGIMSGCLVNVAMLPFQYYGAIEVTQGLGLAAQDATFSYIDTILRAPGMEGHPNSSAAVLSLAVPMSLYLYFDGRARLWVVVLGLAILSVGSHFTENRSAVLISAVTVVVLLLTRRNSGRSLRLGALFAYAGLPILFYVGPPGGWERWSEQSNIETNSGERLSSNVGALRVILEHPLGLGVEAGEQALLQEAGIEATHNAYLQVGLIYGWLLATAVFLCLFFFTLQVFVNSRAVPALEAMLALQVFGLFLFEEHFSAPTFTIVVMWLVAAGAVLLGYYFRATQPRNLTTRHMVHRQQLPN